MEGNTGMFTYLSTDTKLDSSPVPNAHDGRGASGGAFAKGPAVSSYTGIFISIHSTLINSQTAHREID
jgi:hypothetical protein